MRRVLVIGCGGAGKSTLARQLGPILGLEVIHLDTHFWKPGWVETPDAEWDEIVRDLTRREAWIMDGNYSRTLPLRLAAADTVLFLDFARWRCMARVVRRVMRHRGRTRADLGERCPEHWDLAFLRWVWGFKKRSRPRLIEMLARCRDSHRIEVLRSPGAVKRFVQSLSA
jgi:adenylate kinase family enzyme